MTANMDSFFSFQVTRIMKGTCKYCEVSSTCSIFFSGGGHGEL